MSSGGSQPCHTMWALVNIPSGIAILDSLHSKRFRASSSRKLGGEQKNREWGGRGKGAKETFARKAHDFEKLRSPANAASDWRAAGSVDYFALETSIKPGMFCLRASQIWSDLICGRRLQMLWSDIYLNHVIVCAEVYQIWVSSIKSIIWDLVVETSEGQFIGNDGVRIWL